MTETAGAVLFLPREGNRRTLMLEDILFDPAALWLSKALEEAGFSRFLVVCHQDDREGAAACFPKGTEFITTGTEDARERLLTFLEQNERVAAITQPVFLPWGALPRLRCGQTELPPEDRRAHRLERTAPQCHGVYEFTPAGRQALQDGGGIQEVLSAHCRPYEECFFWVDEFSLFGELQTQAKTFSVQRLRSGGVRFLDPQNTYVGPCVTVGEGTLLLPGTILKGNTVIGEGCEIGPHTVIRDCTVGDRVVVNASQLNESTIRAGAKIGPFAYVRPNCKVGRDVKVGDFVELKNSTIGDGTKISHLTYVGDSDVGGGVNFGCGTVTVNYDGLAKFRTTIGDNAFIGCNTNLVAPVKIGDGAYTAAGSTITDDVPPDSLAIARSVQVVKKQWAAKRRSRRK
ncbi:UDP-N-acetylglucosamine diphosphorylase [Pseudoflavonifractor sp. 524-17]|uniref:DapH/DapD/GlmU-related protein n=1 Tax=Pseudoflavonifractor sp. 524-17 TaxID=2304577 RepID=UPI001379A1AD|nr:DapH/DapD/GlmU-related protein [Pseudoflavonifractor sp. 524-17]NCE63800.1 UDP-N-acetylglucosamine diphosphorylase [Pseudoflavonifractor sp. 524-17]